MKTTWLLLMTASPFLFAQDKQTKAPPPPMSFFVSSVGVGKGANLGGIEGGDRQCQSLAAAAGAGNRTWHAYLSAAAANGKPAVNARDRIGHVLVAQDVGRAVTVDDDRFHAVVWDAVRESKTVASIDLDA